MKIYTKTGDQGMTYLFGGGPYPKDTPSVEAYGSVDELNSVLGCVLAEASSIELTELLQRIQKELFVIGSELASVHPNEKMQEGFIKLHHVEDLEACIDRFEERLKPLRQFILPGGSKTSAFLHLARTTCRRAERMIVALSHTQTVRSEILIYMNRLSDLLFVMARIANLEAQVEDVLWEGILKA